ncbi:hypothetical protein TeGR_g13292 [Tetraparma gracilis]|uniref:Protein kinase domain-containing protein n=1 Tax=Tetraparma gracilis TaxID=2962635 RepID=A0ABQ6N2Q7_9STRA|nr:hypothetical protein TeGR_g13292 [Tetraparma gracilis]
MTSLLSVLPSKQDLARPWSLLFLFLFLLIAMPTTTRAQRGDGSETLCPPGSGNYAPPDPCACDVDGLVEVLNEGESMTHVTGAIGCSEEWEGSLFCYVQYDCFAVGVEMTGGGVKWRYCEENEPEPVECQLCPPATASSDTSPLPCTTCPIMTYANDDEGATLCAECPDDAPWAEEGAASLEECKEKPPSFMMAFDSIACENVARMVGRWDPVERTASGRWWYRHEDRRGEDGGLKSLYWDPDASGGSWYFNFCEGWSIFEMFTSPDLYDSASSSFDCVSCEDGGYAKVGSKSAAECVPDNLKLYAYDYSGVLIKTIDTPSGIVNGMAMKPGLCPELTSLLPPAAASTVERIHMPVMLRDRYGDAMPDSFDAASVASDIFVSARGEVQSVDESLALPHTVQGVIEVDGGGLQAAAFSTHNIGLKKQDVNSFKETSLDLTLTPMDRFENVVVVATDVTVSINGGEPIQLTSPLFTHSHVIPARYSGDLVVSFKLDGEDVANSPVTISVAPNDTLYVVGGVFSVLLILGLAGFYYYKQASQNKLVAEKNMLEEEVRRKKHSEDELKVMVEALQSVSKERQDELKEVMIDSMELKIDKLLGKGGFGVVNLGTYRSIKVAVKQLLTVNEENVLRFRHECFLMKNLSHPNVVKLVGVCWSEELFACCLEFAENGSLEDWLRRTVGGKTYKKPQKKVLGMTGAMTEAETVAKGFDSEGLYDEAKHTETDKTKLEECNVLIDKCRIEVTGHGGGVEEGWEKVLEEDGAELGEGVNAWQRYDKGARQGLGIAHVVIDAAPSCVMARFMDERNDGTSKHTKTFERSFTAGVYYTLVPVKIPTISDRDSLFGKGLGFISKIAAHEANKFNAAPLVQLKKDVRRLLEEHKVGPLPSLASVVYHGFDHDKKYNPAEHTDVDRAKKEEAEKLLHDWWMQRMNPKMSWTEMLKEDGSRMDHGLSGYHKYDKDTHEGMAMAHGFRHNGATNDVEEEEAGWKESVIHRDLKPDNMLLTRDWTLKLTDFGEARAQNMGGTMTSVGTPIYIAPEVMRADHYDEKADTWSYGLCLVAMIRAERTLEQFFYQSLRKHKKRRTTKGLGMGQMTKYYYSEGWRPILPLAFVKAYPKLHTLIQECWRVRRKERPNFDQIVSRLQGDIGDEIKRKEEPQVTLYSKEDDLIYRNRIGKEDEIEDSDGEDGGGMETGKVATGRLKKQHEKAMKEVMEQLVAEKKRAAALVEKHKEEIGALEAKLGAGGGGGGDN